MRSLKIAFHGGIVCPATVQLKPLTLKAGVVLLTLVLLGFGGASCLAQAAVSPTTLNWVSVAVGNKGGQKVVTLTNSGTTAIAISGISLTGANPGDFEIYSKTCEASLAGSSACTVNVLFAPTTTGERYATLEFTDSASGSPQTMTLTGKGVSSGASASPSSLSFASTTVGSSSAAQTATLSNAGTSAITIDSVAIAGTDSGDFSITSKTCGTSLGASSSCGATVVFKPTATGARSATLDFTDSATGSPQTVTLTGTGAAATTGGTASVSPTTLNWVSVDVGVGGGPKSVTLTNSGTTAINISSIATSGANPGDFRITSKTCGSSLAASGTCTATIAFYPTAAGARSATLAFTDSASDSPQTMTLTGKGVGAGVSVNPASLTFSSTAVGSSSTSQTATLSNTTTAAVAISSVAITGTNSGDFSITSNTCGTSVGASSSCGATVVFKPTATGTRTATLAFTDAASNSPQTVALSGDGTGTSGTITVSPSSVTFASTAVGSSSASQSATLSNTTTAAVAISGVAITGTDAGDFSITSNTCGTSVGASSSCGATVVFKPTATGTRTATLAFTDAASNSPQTVSLSGNGGGASSGSLAVYPSSAAVAVGSQQVFQAQLSGVPDSNSLSYSIDGVSGGNSTTGTVTNQGLYTAPNFPGSHQLTVTDNSHGTTSNSSITVYSNVTVDFGSRATNANPVPAGLFGAQYLESLHTAADLDLVKAGGITSGRMYAGIISVFASSTPNWTSLDSTIARVTGAGSIHLLIEMYQTPTWLQQNNCGIYSMPSDVNAWASIAQQYVKHLDATFPGIVTDYEIWNEPDISLCVPSGDNVMTDYMNLYAAAAPLMKAQAKADGQTIRVGGPVTAGVLSSWITAMLNNPSIYQNNIDFISYHKYLIGVPGEKATWDTYNGTESVYQATQDIQGPANAYEYVGTLVSEGKQPQGKNLPVYITEYNLDWEFAKNCCSNDFTYAPLWNALYVADLLDTPFAYSTAPNSISRLDYYAASAVPYYCLIGLYDTNMDCSYPSGSTPQPYPQLFAYQLLGSPSYLGLQNGAYMAASISPPRLSNGLVVTAFFTPSLDAIVLINPSQYTYSDMPVNIANSGLTSPAGTLYQIANGQSIQSSSVSLQSQGGTSYSTTVTIGPYSVQAISLHH